MEKKSVMVLGAGFSGLCAAKSALESGFQVTIFEKVDQIGGLWYYKEDPEHICMYEDLITNQPKEIMEYPDFFFPHKDQWYFSIKEVQEYLIAYAKKFNVDKVIEFNHEVLLIRPEKGGWDVTVKNLITGEQRACHYDFVVICNGHYTTPSKIEIKGRETFKGEQIHSVQYRRVEPYRGKRILIIGSGVSALDIMFLLSKVCEVVYFSQRTRYELTFKVPENLKIRPVVKELTETGAVFEDGTSCEVDAIIYATGYTYDFPFLSPECGITVEENQVKDLFKHCINIKYPSMALIGMPFFVAPQLLMDMQSRFVMRIWSGAVELPSQVEMLKETKDDLRARLDEGWPRRHAHKMDLFLQNYHNDLADFAGLERTKNVFFNVMFHYLHRPVKDFLNFRKERYEIIDDDNFKVSIPEKE